MRGTMQTALLELQQAVFERLANDAIIKAMVGTDSEGFANVFDEVKQGTKLPYITIGDDTANGYDTKTNYGEDITLTIHAWSKGPGKTEAKRIMNAILAALTKTKLVLENFDLEGIERDFLETFNDGQVYHGVCRFRVYIKHF